MPGLKLFFAVDSPPSLAIRLLLEKLGVEHQIVTIDFNAGEHLKESFAKMNPQKEIPCIDDNGFVLNESVAILQYIADKYAKDDSIYPRDAVKRALVNQRLMFNISTYYSRIGQYVLAPIYYSHAFQRSPEGLAKLNQGLSLFNTYLSRGGTKYVAGDSVTIADFAMIAATSCLEAIDFSLDEFPLVAKWYADFKKDFPELWVFVNEGVVTMHKFSLSPPDLTGLDKLRTTA